MYVNHSRPKSVWILITKGLLTLDGYSNIFTWYMFDVQDGTLTKEEVRVFIHRAVKDGIFTAFFGL